MSEVITKDATRVLTGKLHRVRRGRAQAFVSAAPPPRLPVPRPARLAVMLALAHKIEAAIHRGVVRDRAEAARRLGLTRSRITQLLDLTLLAPDIQGELLELEAVDGVEPLCEYRTRVVAHAGTWDQLRERWREVTDDRDARESMPAIGPGATGH